MGLETVFNYTDSVKYAAVAQWASLTAYTVGQLVRQTAPTDANARVFVCVIAGTSLAAEPTWVVTAGAKTAEALGPTWQECTGHPAMNGSVDKTAAWDNGNVKNKAIAIGTIIKDVAATHYFICDTAGTAGNGAEPTWDMTAGNTTADNTVTWRCFSPVVDFSSPFGAPHKRIGNAVIATWSNPGDTHLVGHQHAYTVAAAYTILFTGTAALRDRCLCVSNTASDPTAVITGASETTTGASNLNISGFGVFDGISFSAGTSSASMTVQFGILTTTSCIAFYNCTISIPNSNASARITIGTTISTNPACFLYFKNVTFTFGGTGGGFDNFIANSIFDGCTFCPTGSVPTNLFRTSQGNGIIYVFGGDASTINTNLVLATLVCNTKHYFENLKLHASVTPVNGSFKGPGTGSFLMFHCDSSTGYYREYYADYLGTVQSETTLIRTGGATDGVTPISLNCSSGNSSLYFPLNIGDLIFYNTNLASMTATVELESADAALTNADVWMEASYLNSASFPTKVIATSRVAGVFATPAALNASSASWGGAAKTHYNISLTFAPAMKGAIKIALKLAKANTVIYVDPKITLDSIPNGKEVRLSQAGFTEIPNSLVMGRGILTGGRR